MPSARSYDIAAACATASRSRPRRSAALAAAIPKEHLNVPVDYESLTALGAP